jgi:uncharacterized damage-inducible protein DinB
MTIAAAFATELRQEATATKRVLDRVPEQHLAWQPHPKSMSLGQLALHVATLPGQLVQFVAGDALDVDAVPKTPPAVATRGDLLAAFAASVERAQTYLGDLSDDRAMATWRLVAGDRPLIAAPRAGVVRSFLFNHWYHHRGQLVVYLRLLDVPVPSVYGPSADENPFDVG